MSDIQNYISNLYSSSAESMIPTYSTAGFTSSESLLGKRQSTDVGSRALPTLPTYNANVQFGTGDSAIDYSFGSARESANQLLLGSEAPVAAKSFSEKAASLDLGNLAKTGKDLYKSFQTDTPSIETTATPSIETPTGDVGAAGVNAGDPGIMGSEGAGGAGGFEGSADAAAGASSSGAAAGGGGLSAAQIGGISMAATVLGSGIETIADDSDPTTWNVGEASGSVLKGAGKGAGIGAMIGTTVLPGIGTGVGAAIGAGVGAVTNFIGGLTGRNKARREAEEKAEAQMKAARTSLKAQGLAQFGMGQMKSQQSRMQAAGAGMTSMLDKYGVNLERGGMISSPAFEGTRPIDLKYIKLSKEHDDYSHEDYIETPKVKPFKKPEYNTNYGLINKNFKRGGKVKFDKGGVTDGEIPEVIANENWSLNPTTEAQKNYMDSLAENDAKWKADREAKELEFSQQKAEERYNRIMNTSINKRITNIRDAADITFAGGVASGNLPAMWYGKTISGGIDAGRFLASNVMELMHPDENWNKQKQKHLINAGITLAPVKRLEKFQGLRGVYTAFKGTKAGKTVIKNVKEKGSDILNFMKNRNIPLSAKQSLTNVSYMGPKYEIGGMTKGKFSHEENPLTVVDKHGNDTGMELTGGEGVFDKGAMKKLEKYKSKNNFKKAGELVFSEMDDWKDAGTAKYGGKIKKYYG